MECFSTTELFVYGVADTCSFLDTPFFTAKVFWGGLVNAYGMLLDFKNNTHYYSIFFYSFMFIYSLSMVFSYKISLNKVLSLFLN